MKQFLKNNILYLAGLSLLLVLGLCFYFNMSKGDIILFFSERRSTSLNYFFRFSNSLGEGYAYLIIGLGLLLYRFSHALMILVTGFCTMLLSQFLKNFFGKPRPAIYFSELKGQPEAIIPVPEVELVTSWTSSFPSGHTMAAFALYGLLAFSVKRKDLKILFLLMASLAGISRIYLGQHFLQDVLAGAFFGTLVAMLMYALQCWLGQENRLGRRGLLGLR